MQQNIDQGARQEDPSQRKGGPRWWAAARRFVEIAAGKSKERPPVRIGLALGGGFARGIAHLGVLRVFERHHIPIHCLAGVSAGSMVAAAYASGCEIAEIERVARSMKFRDVARWTVNFRGLAGSDRMAPFLRSFLKQDRFENMKTPLAVVATDLVTGAPAVFRDKGDVVLPVRASCSYPGLFQPIRHGERCLVDGVIGMEVPAKPLRSLGATKVISIHLPSPANCPDPSSMFSVVFRSFQVLSERLESEWRRHSDLVLTPDVSQVAWDSFESAGQLIERGEQAALAALPVIQRWLQPNSSPREERVSPPRLAADYAGES